MKNPKIKKRAEIEIMPKKLKYYDSMAQAASCLGLSVDTLKAAKSSGCPAFRGSRVYADELQTWLTHPRTGQQHSTEQLIDRLDDAHTRLCLHLAFADELGETTHPKRDALHKACKQVSNAIEQLFVISGHQD